MTVDFGRRSDDYAEHRPGFPPWCYDRLASHRCLGGLDALDLGTGPGKIAVELARRGCRVIGVDTAANQIAAAERVAAAAGVAETGSFRVVPAEATGLDDACVDLVTAGQCWHWFDHGRALDEARRVLRPGGRLVVAHYSYLVSRSEVAAATERLILEHNPAWTMAGSDGMYPEHVDALQENGMRLVEQFCRDHDEPFTHAAWRGRIRTCNGVGSGVLADEQVGAFDAELARLLARDFPDEPLVVPHRVWATIVEK